MKQEFLEIQKEFHKSPESKRFQWQTTHPYISAREREVLASILKHKYPLALELGCGEAANTFNLRTAKWKTPVIGIDYSPEKAVFANSNKIKDSRFFCRRHHANSIPQQYF